MSNIVFLNRPDPEMKSSFYKLKDMGYKMKFLTSERDPISLIQQKLPRLIVVDLSTPVPAGIELLKQIRKHKITTNIPIMVLTAMPNQEMLEFLKACNITELILKPSSHDFVSRVFTLINQWEMEQITQLLKQMHVDDKELRKLSCFGSNSNNQNSNMFSVTHNGVPVTFKIAKPHSPRRLLQENSLSAFSKALEIYVKTSTWKKVWPPKNEAKDYYLNHDVEIELDIELGPVENSNPTAA